MKVKIYALIPFLAFISCTQSVLIKNNGQAQLVVSIYDFRSMISDTISSQQFVENLKKEYNSPIISDLKIDTSSNDLIMNMNVKKIDSLGNYLSPFFDYKVVTQFKNKQFTIKGSDGNAKPEDDIGGWTSLLVIDLTLQFERSIKNITTKSKYYEKINEKAISIKTNLSEMDYQGFENSLTVELN